VKGKYFALIPPFDEMYPLPSLSFAMVECLNAVLLVSCIIAHLNPSFGYFFSLRSLLGSFTLLSSIFGAQLIYLLVTLLNDNWF